VIYIWVFERVHHTHSHSTAIIHVSLCYPAVSSVMNWRNLLDKFTACVSLWMTASRVLRAYDVTIP